MVPWIWTGILLNVVATGILAVNTWHAKFLNVACLMLFVGIWVEKGFGLIILGFIPGQWGKIVEYTPSIIEIAITLAIYAMGAFIFTILARVGIAVELGEITYKKK